MKMLKILLIFKGTPYRSVLFFEEFKPPVIKILVVESFIQSTQSLLEVAF